jgi:hypothetical protein
VNFSLFLSAVYPYGDPRRIFAQGNQEKLWHLVSEVWRHCAPTPKRIGEDISCWPAIHKNIVAVNGAVVVDYNFRTSRRVLQIGGKVNAGGTKTCKIKLKKRDRKDSVAHVLVCHPLLKEAERAMLGLPPRFRPPPPRPPPPPRLILLCMIVLSRLQPLPSLLLSLLLLLLPLLPLLLAAGSSRAVASELRPGPGSRLLLKLKPPCARSRTRARVRNPTTTTTAICYRSARK